MSRNPQRQDSGVPNQGVTTEKPNPPALHKDVNSKTTSIENANRKIADVATVAGTNANPANGAVKEVDGTGEARAAAARADQSDGRRRAPANGVTPANGGQPANGRRPASGNGVDPGKSGGQADGQRRPPADAAPPANDGEPVGRYEFRWKIADRILTPGPGVLTADEARRLRRTGMIILFLDYCTPLVVPVLSLVSAAVSAILLARHGWHGLGTGKGIVVTVTAVGTGILYTGALSWKKIKSKRSGQGAADESADSSAGDHCS